MCTIYNKHPQLGAYIPSSTPAGSRTAPDTGTGLKKPVNA